MSEETKGEIEKIAKGLENAKVADEPKPQEEDGVVGDINKLLNETEKNEPMEVEDQNPDEENKNKVKKAKTPENEENRTKPEQGKEKKRDTKPKKPKKDQKGLKGGVSKPDLAEKKDEERRLKKVLNEYVIPHLKAKKEEEASSSSSSDDSQEMAKMKEKQRILEDKLDSMSKELDKARAKQNTRPLNRNEEDQAKCQMIMHMIAELSEGQGHFQTINKLSDISVEPCPEYNERGCKKGHPHRHPTLGYVERICSTCRMGANINNPHPKYKCQLFEKVKEALEKARERKALENTEKKKEQGKSNDKRVKMKMTGKEGKGRKGGKGGKWFRK